MESTTDGRAAPGSRAPIVVALATATAWYVLLGHDPSSWIIGLPCIVLSAALSRGLPAAQRARVSPVGWIRLLLYFLLHSLLGGWDVARRVMAPGLPLDPGYVDFELHIAQGPARTFYIQFIGLLPGTLAVWLEGNSLRVHVLDRSTDIEQALRTAERRVAEAFALTRDEMT